MDAFLKEVEVEGGRVESCCAMPLVWMVLKHILENSSVVTGPLGNLVLWWGFPDIPAFEKGIQMMQFPAPKNHKATIFCGYLSWGSPGEVHSCGQTAVSVG